MEKRKIIGAFLGVVLFLVLMAGISYAYLAFSKSTTSDNMSKSGKIDVVFTSGADLTGALRPSSDKEGGISSTSSIRITTGSLPAKGILKLNITSISTEIATSALKWEVYKDSETTPYNSGDFNGVSSGDIIEIVKDYQLTTTDTNFTIYIWLDGNLSGDEVLGSSFSANITASSSQISGTIPAAYEIMDLSGGDSWESGASGLYATNSYTDTDGSTKYHEYRYVGANVNNYVSFNNDMYQIIGVFDSDSHGRTGEYLIKLIAVNTLGGYSWGVYNTSNTSGTYSNYASDWTGTTTGVKANLNVLFNEYFLNKTIKSSTYGNCGDWTYYYSDNSYKTNDCSYIVGYGIDSSLRDYIETTTWYLYGSGDNQSKQNWYLCERGGNSCTSANSSAYSSYTEAKIGLMYVSDYLYASGYYSNSDTTDNSAYYYGKQNWLYKGMERTITPNVNSSRHVWLVNYGYVNNGYTNSPDVLRPSFYLKSSIYVTGGSGTFEDPYTIGCDDCTS